MTDPRSPEAIGKTAIAAKEFTRWVVEQTQDGCEATLLAAGIACGLEAMAEADLGSRQFRTVLATLLKEYALP